MSFRHICTYGACHLTITTKAKCHLSTHLYMYKLYTYYVCITHMIIRYFIIIYDVTIHAHCTYGDRPLDRLLSLCSTERTFGRRCPFDFSGFIFSLYFSLLRHSRYTDRTSPRLLLHCIEYYAWPK